MTPQTSDINALLPVCVAEVLETMFFAAAEPEGTMDAPLEEGWISVAVDFQGTPSGFTRLWLTVGAARSLTADFLGLEADEVDQEKWSQTACELSNMICGSIVSRIESNAAFTLSAPRLEVPPGPFHGPAPSRFVVDNGVMAVACALAG